MNPEDVFALHVALEKSAKAFVRLRYAFEGMASDFTVSPLIFAVRQIILSKHPEWDPELKKPR